MNKIEYMAWYGILLQYSLSKCKNEKTDSNKLNKWLN